MRGSAPGQKATSKDALEAWIGALFDADPRLRAPAARAAPPRAASPEAAPPEASRSTSVRRDDTRLAIAMKPVAFTRVRPGGSLLKDAA